MSKRQVVSLWPKWLLLVICIGPWVTKADCILPFGKTGALDFESYDSTYMYCSNSEWRKVCASTSSDTSLVGHWTFDGTAGILAYDSSGSNHHGTWSGATSVNSVSGKIKNAYNFDGVDDYVDVVRTVALEPSSAITVAAWIYWETPSNSNYGKVVAKTNGGVLSYGFSQVSTTSEIQAELHASSGFTTASLGTIANNQWVHIAMTWAAGEKLKVFVNGSKVSETASNVSGSLAYSSSNLRIGHNANGQADNQFDGSIDDVRIYSRRLTEAEILRLGSQTSSPVPVIDPVANWGLDESGATTSVTDSVGAMTGTMQNGLSGADSVAGQVGSGLQFDGANDYISFASDATVNLTDVTISFWIKPDAVTSSKNGIVLMENRDSGSGLNYELAIDGSGNVTPHDGKYRISYYNGGWYTVVSDALAVAGSWAHLMFVVDSTNLTYTFYVNGVASGSGALPAALASHSGSTLYIGSSKDTGNNDYFDGALDDVRIYNDILEPHQALNVYVDNQELVCPQLSSCSVIGEIDFDSTTGLFKFCDGGSWRALGGMQSIGSCSNAGQFFYESLSHRLHFCDGSDLYEM